MIRNEHEFAKKITGYLDSGASGMRAGTLYRLQQARARALESLAAPTPVVETRMAHALAGIGPTPDGAGGDGGLRRSGWLGLGAVLVGAMLLFGWQQWATWQQAHELAELDVQILTSDLPIDAYVDQGFRTWLTSNAR